MLKNETASRWAPWLLLALVLGLLLPGTASLPLVDRDEPRFATATREMMQRADWIVPTFNGHFRFDKPVLTYWLMRVGYSIFGFSEFGARLHAIAATLVLVWVTWWIGRRWFGEREGFLAAAMLASCLQVFIHGRLALADMPMVACVVLACLAIKELLESEEDSAGSENASTIPVPEGDRAPTALGGMQDQPRFCRRRWWWTLYLALGFGFLAKGPIVFAVPALALILYRFVFWRKSLPWKNLSLFPGLVLSLLIVGSWGIPALLVTHGLFWKVGMGEHVIQRGFERFNGRGYSPFFYLATAPMSLFPWIALIGFLPAALARGWSDRIAWLVSWLVAPYLIFTAYATQLPHYVLPAFPALFLLLSRVMAADRAAWPRAALWFAWGFLGVIGLGLVAAALAIKGATLPSEIEPLRSGLTGATLVLLSLILGAALLLAGRRWSILVALLGVMVGGQMMGRSLRTTSLTASAAGWAKDLPNDTHWVGAGFSEPSLVFYSGRTWDFPQDDKELEMALRSPGDLVVVSLLNEIDPLQFFRVGLAEKLGRTMKPISVHQGSEQVSQLLERYATGSGWETHEVAGFNLGRTRWQHVRISIRTLPH